MKRLPAALLAGSLLFLSACGQSAQTEPTASATAAGTTAATSVAVETEPTAPDGIAPNLSLLPDGFPTLPKNIVNLSVSTLSGTGKPTDYALDRKRVSFDCYELAIYSLSSSLEKQGFRGACRNDRTGKYFERGFHGAWKSDEYLLVIDYTDENVDGSLHVSLDFLRNEPCFPQALAEYYPALDAPARSRGHYFAYNAGRANATETFKGSLDRTFWQWQFMDDDAFIGITQSDFRSYMNELQEQGFSGDVVSGLKDGFMVYSGKLVRLSDTGDCGVFFDYFESTQMLQIIYSNDLNYFLGENWQSRSGTMRLK